MLKDILEKIDCTNDYQFDGSSIILFSPTNKLFYKIAFGGGDNADDLEEGCDDYMYLQIDRYNDDGDFEEDYDGGQFEFAQKDYSGYINDEKLIRDCLEFLGCLDVENLVLIDDYHTKMKSFKMLLKINGEDVSKAISFAYDGCHKIYLCKNEEEENEHIDCGYAIYQLNDLPQIFENTCELRFINWSNLTPIVKQGENKVVFSFNIEEVVQFY